MPAVGIGELVDAAEVVFAGRVVGMQEGFFNGQAGTLLHADGEYLKGPSNETTYVFYPLAKIATSHGLICNKPFRPFTPPQIGDQIIVFQRHPAPLLLERGVILYPHADSGLIHLSKSGSFHAPTAVVEQTLADVFGQIRARITARKKE